MSMHMSDAAAAQPLDRSIAASLERVKRNDPIGHRFHFAFAVAHLFMLPLDTVGNGITFGILVVYAVVRLPNTRQCYDGFWRVKSLWLFAIFIAWLAASLMWSLDVEQGLDELTSMRVILLPFALWPIITEIPWLIGAALVGVAAQNASQFGEWLSVQFESLSWMALRPAVEHGRLGGRTHPIQTGGWCAAAMCWYVPVILRSCGWRRWLSAAGFFAATAGLIASGSRGPWIAAAVALPIELLWIGLRQPGARRTALVAAIITIVALAAAWPLARNFVSSRVNDAIAEVQAAREAGEFWTPAGLRVQLWVWSAEIVREKPLLGGGAGSFRKLVQDKPDYQRAAESHPELAEYMAPDHAHSVYMHSLACYGVIGAGLFLGLLIAVFMQCAREPRDHVFAGASFFVLLAWCIGSVFDSWHLSGHMFGMFALILSITLPMRPALNARSCAPASKDD